MEEAKKMVFYGVAGDKLKSKQNRFKVDMAKISPGANCKISNIFTSCELVLAQESNDVYEGKIFKNFTEFIF